MCYSNAFDDVLRIPRTAVGNEKVALLEVDTQRCSEYVTVICIIGPSCEGGYVIGVAYGSHAQFLRPVPCTVAGSARTSSVANQMDSAAIGPDHVHCID